MNEKKIYQEFCWDLTKKYLDELSGNGEKDDYIYEIRPTEKIAIGILDSGINNDEATRYTSMPMIKVQFYVDSHETGELSLNLKGNLYYNVLPTYQEQLEYAKKCEDIIKNGGKSPKIKCVICGLSNAAYKRSDGVFVVPITALKE